MDIVAIISKLDLNLLKEQGEFLDGIITQLESDYNEAITDEVAERINIDIDYAKGLLGLVDSIVVALETK